MSGSIMDNEDLIAQFMELTASDIITARKYLSAYKWDLGRSIENFFSGTPLPKSNPPSNQESSKLRQNTSMLQASPTKPTKPQRQYITAGTHEIFTKVQNEAKEKNRLLFIVLYEEFPLRSLSKAECLQDLFNCLI